MSDAYQSILTFNQKLFNSITQMRKLFWLTVFKNSEINVRRLTYNVKNVK